MKTMLSIVLLGTLAFAGVVSASSVTNVGLSYENGGTIARITVQGPIRFTHQTEIPKDGKPDRMILDVIGATNEMAVKSFAGLPACGITAIRTSQYAVKPEKIVRLVFDMSKAPIYQVEAEGSAIRIHFTDNAVKPFGAWTAIPSTPATPPSAKPVETKPAMLAQQPTSPAKGSTPEQKANATEQDRQASLSAGTPAARSSAPAAKPEVKPTPTVSAAPAPAAKPAESKPELKPSTPATTAPAAKPEVKPTPTVATAPAPAAKPAEAKPELKPSTPATIAPAAKPEVKPTPTVAAAPAPAVKPADAKPELKPSTPATTAPAAKPEVKPTPAVAVAPAPSVKPAEAKPEQKPSTSVLATNTQSTPPANPPAPQAKESTPDAKPTNAAKPVSEPSEELAQSPTDNAQFAPTDTTRSTARFRRNANSQTKIKGTMVAEFPQRLVVKYEGQEYRDPFAPLLDDTRTFNSPIRERMPNVEGLKLVGIIESSDGDNRALFEDKSGYSYMLQSGDKVQKGYVLRVERDRVYFQIFEYGWSRTIALAIEDVSGQ